MEIDAKQMRAVGVQVEEFAVALNRVADAARRAFPSMRQFTDSFARHQRLAELRRQAKHKGRPGWRAV